MMAGCTVMRIPCAAVHCALNRFAFDHAFHNATLALDRLGNTPFNPALFLDVLDRLRFDRLH